MNKETIRKEVISELLYEYGERGTKITASMDTIMKRAIEKTLSKAKN